MVEPARRGVCAPAPGEITSHPRRRTRQGGHLARDEMDCGGHEKLPPSAAGRTRLVRGSTDTDLRMCFVPVGTDPHVSVIAGASPARRPIETELDSAKPDDLDVANREAGRIRYQRPNVLGSHMRVQALLRVPLLDQQQLGGRFFELMQLISDAARFSQSEPHHLLKTGCQHIGHTVASIEPGDHDHSTVGFHAYSPEIFASALSRKAAPCSASSSIDGATGRHSETARAISFTVGRKDSTTIVPS